MTTCYVHSVVQAHEAKPRRRHLGVSVMPSQADTEASLLKPATRTGILAIFMTQAEKESATPPAFDLLKRPGFVEALLSARQGLAVVCLDIFNPSYPAGGKVSELFV